MKRIQWDQLTVDGPEQTTAYMTNIPGLVTYRRPGGWYVGHFSSGRRVNSYPVPRRPDAEALAMKLSAATDFTAETFENLPEEVKGQIRSRINVLEHEFMDMQPWQACDDTDCLRTLGHPGTHQSHGRTWRREK
jgi:hypothetical protein